jgi:acyl-CoA reductase-like NAD-dependent aldehyde dehydrogenase
MTVKCVSPVNGETYAEREYSNDEVVDQTFASAANVQGDWAALSIAQRAQYCTAAVDAMLAMADEIIPELSWQMGRPVRYGQGELSGFEERARHMISIVEASLAPMRPEQHSGFDRYVQRDPLGVVFTIAPWNYPYLTAVNSIIPALMAGNTVVLKHAQSTLLVAERFQKAFDTAGLPKGVFQHLMLSHSQTARIISEGLADMVCFTGSVPGGASIETAAVGKFIPVGLELGGKDPAYVRGDCDVNFATENLVDGAFFNSGQSCCGIERIYVDENIFDAFVERFVEIVNGYVLGDPLDEATTLGPMIKADAADFVRGQIKDAVNAGAKAHIDAGNFPATARGAAYMAPQVLTKVNHQMSVMTEESFGPVVGIMAVKDDEEAIALMNDSDFGLTASVWTPDEAAARAIGARVNTGTFFMNRCDYLDPALAWTGVNDSGRGCTLSSLGYEALTRPKSFHLKINT